MKRRDEVARLLSDVGLALDDDDIAHRLGMNRRYVNTICRGLAEAGFTARFRSSDGKLAQRLRSRIGDG